METKKQGVETSQSIISLNNVSKKYGNFIALRDISFELRKGTRLGIVGANGAGKTTLTEIIAGVNKPTTGEIYFGFEYKKSPQEYIGMQFQDSTYPSGLTVKDIIKFARDLHKITLTSAQIKDLLNSFQMLDVYNRKARSLSGGQKQKLNILLAVLHQPKLVILDELSTGLDVAAREDIISFTDDLLSKFGITAIVISHHMEEIKTLCEEVIVLDRGMIRNHSTIQAIEDEYHSLSDFLKSIIKENQDATLVIGHKRIPQLSNAADKFFEWIDQREKTQKIQIEQENDLNKKSKKQSGNASKTEAKNIRANDVEKGKGQ